MAQGSDAGSVFMCFGSLPGDAQAPGQISKSPASGGWIRLLSCQWSGSINYGARSADGVSDAADASPVVITKVTDSSSTGLLRQAILGDFRNSAVIVFIRTGSGGKPDEYLRLELENCGIVDFGIANHDGERSTETYTIQYGAMDVRSFAFEGASQRNQVSYTIVNQG
jgi:type VI protein secretion system component Hcp